MKNKLEVGMYVRTKEGLLWKPKKIEIDEDGCYLFDDYYYFEPEQIYKSSHNIIDLIEEGDYVNGYKVTKVNKDRFFTNEQDYYAGGWGNKIYGKDFKTDIKSIVTKEQFKSVEFEV